MLHCRGGYFYVGHTDDIDKRIGEHKSGLIPGFTADHQPVELVWSDQFENRDDAKAAERKLKGWSRAKKLALIRGDWERISALAKKKDSPSTSSGKTGKGGGRILHSDITSFPKPVHAELVEALSFSLLPHPDTPPLEIEGVEGWISFNGADYCINYQVFGATPKVSVSGMPARTDGLWQFTCFELFVKPDEGESYLEFNFVPGGSWAAYSFDRYRMGQTDLSVCAPKVESIESGIRASGNLGVAMSNRSSFAISAVIEETDGTKSYWALAHPPGAPDFHHPSCFTISLPPPSET